MATWREVSGYEGYYLVSDEGAVVSIPRKIRSGNKTICRKGKRLKSHLRGRCGLMYEAVFLSKGGMRKHMPVHRLVATAFLPNPDNLPEVNHKDENPLNNRVENLEWCSRQYNIEYSKNKPVRQMHGDCEVAVFKSIKDASAKTGIKRRSINNVLTGWSATAGGYRWEYC